MGLCGLRLHLGCAEQHAIDRRCPAGDHTTGQVPTIGQAGEHEALTGDDRVDERQHSVEHLIVRGQTVHARGAPRAGQVRIEAHPAVPLREEGFHEPSHDAVIARRPRQHHDGPTGAVGFIEDRDISEVTFHMLIPPFVHAHTSSPSARAGSQSETKNSIDSFQEKYTRWGAVFPGDSTPMHTCGSTSQTTMGCDLWRILSFESTRVDSKENLQGFGCLLSRAAMARRARPERLRLPLWLRFNGLVDLPEVAFWIGKVRRAQPPGLVGWGSEKRDSLGL